MREKGEYIRKGSLGADGDVEFYDETVTSEFNDPSAGSEGGKQ